MKLSARALAQYAMEVSSDDFSDDVIMQTKKLVVDSLGCTIGGYPSPPSKTLRRTYGTRGPGEATVLGTTEKLPLEYAGLINTAMVRYLDFNDCYTTGKSACHPSDHIPALLSVAEHVGASGTDLIEAIVLAYEIHCRGVDEGEFWPRGFDYVTWGSYAVALAAGKLLKFDEDALTNALAIAATSANGLLISRLGTVSMWKGVAQPYADHNALQACQMVRNGMTGPERVFEGVKDRDGEGGLFHAVTNGPVEFSALDGRNDAFRILETSFKAFACGYFTHPSVTAVLDLVREHDIVPEDIDSILVKTFDHAVQVYASGPEKWAATMNRETADHSLPYNVSVGIIDGEVTPDQYDESHLRDERVHELMAKIDVESDPELTTYRQKNPRHTPAEAIIQARDERFEKRVNYPIGHPERPMTMEQIEQKFHGLASTLTESQRDMVIDFVSKLEKQEHLDELFDTLVI